MLSSNTTVLVTGGSGFLASYCIIALLNAGYKVRATIRSLSKTSQLEQALKSGGLTDTDLNRLKFVEADLDHDQGWDTAVAGCTYLLHVASPIPTAEPKDANDLIIPAREGTLRVLRAAVNAGSVKRVVLTSSFNAIAYGYPDQPNPFTEDSWSNPNAKLGAYPRSKLVAERAAWEFVRSQPSKGGLELTSINPTAMLGPVLNKEHVPSSIHIVESYLSGAMPASLNLYMGVADVRDVAALQVVAMTHPDAKGERFIAVSPGGGWMHDIPLTIKKRFPEDATKKVSTKVLPIWLTKVLGMFNPQIAIFVSELGKRKMTSSEKAARVLGWKPVRAREEVIVDTAQSLIDLGLVKH
ncbi:Dihydroflavonol-4-reductase [Talaromyces pinophilus]|nr:Dihydroflavonol-4-reductase [Talaromyces pinophilus]